MNFDLNFDFKMFFLILFLILITLISEFNGNMWLGLEVKLIEGGQAVFLFGAAIFTWLYMKSNRLKTSSSMFWIWAATWWLMLFGRSISWGRDYFPDLDHFYFRIVSTILIGIPVFMLFFDSLRKEIIYKFKHDSLPFWYLVIALIALIFADSVEHSRFITAFLFENSINKDLVEELYEIPFMLSLFYASFELMKKDKDRFLDRNLSTV